MEHTISKPEIKYVETVAIDEYAPKIQQKIRRLEKYLRATEDDYQKKKQKLISDFDKFESENPILIKNYKRAFSKRKVDKSCNLTTVESEAWIKVGTLINNRNKHIMKLNSWYRETITSYIEQRRTQLEYGEEEKQRIEAGKALYDTPEKEEKSTVRGLSTEEYNQCKRDLKELSTLIDELIQIQEESVIRSDQYEVGSHEKAVCSRTVNKVTVYLNIARERYETREQILKGKRAPFSILKEAEVTDEGYSDIEELQSSDRLLIKRLRRRKERIPHIPLLQGNLLDQGELRLGEGIQVGIEELEVSKLQEEEEKEEGQDLRYLIRPLAPLVVVEEELRGAIGGEENPQRILEQPLEEPQSPEDTETSQESESEEEDTDLEELLEDNMANQPRWSFQNIPKFEGEGKQDPTNHVIEFEDIVLASNLDPDLPARQGNEDDAAREARKDYTRVLRLFATTLTGKARTWYNTTLADYAAPQLTPQYREILQAFKNKFDPVGETKEIKLSTFKTMTWNPAVDNIDEYAHKYQRLGKALDMTDPNILLHFRTSLPPMAQWFARGNTINEVITAIKQLRASGMEFGSGFPATPTQAATTSSSIAAIPATPATPAPAQAKFMAMPEPLDPSELAQFVTDGIQQSLDDRFDMMGEGLDCLNNQMDNLYTMVNGNQRQFGQQNQGSGQSNWNRQFQPRRNTFNNRGGNQRNWSTNRGNSGFNQRQSQGGQSNQRSQFTRGKEEACSFCGKFRHSIGNCYALTSELRRRGFSIGKLGQGQGQGQGQRPQGSQGANNQRFQNSGRGGFTPRGRGNFRGNNSGRDRFNMCSDDIPPDPDDMGYDLDQEEDICAAISEFCQETGYEVLAPGDNMESTNE